MERKRGMFIVFEGSDGSGKGTQMINLAGHIKDLDKYKDVILTHEPWRSEEIKRKLKEDKEAYSDGIKMAGLYVNDRINHSEEINSRLNEGYFVLCDRYKLSTCAYQWTQGVDLYRLLKMHEDLIAHYNSLISRKDAKSLFGEIISVNGRDSKDDVAEKVESVFDSFYEKWKNNEQKS